MGYSVWSLYAHQMLVSILERSSEERNLEVPLDTAFENVQNKFSHTGLDLCTDL